MAVFNIREKSLFLLNLLFFIVLLFIFFNIRPILDTDEFINVARGHNAKDIMDYTQRPLYRIINIFWSKTLGPGLGSLLIGSAIFFTFMYGVISIFTWHISKNILLVFVSTLIIFISPEIIKTGLGALPHIYSGFFLLLYGIFSYLKIQSLDEDNNKFFIYFLISYLSAYVALMMHPTMLVVIIIAPFIDFLLILFIKFFSQEYSKYIKKYILSFAVSFFVLWILIIFTEFVYTLYKDQGIPSYFYRWYKAFFGVRSASHSNYIQPYTFYLAYLFKHFPTFFLLWLSSILFLIYAIFIKKTLIDIKKISILIPTFISIIHISALSSQAFKVPDALASFAPMATLSIIFFANEIYRKNYLKIKVAIFIVLILSTVLTGKSFFYVEHSMNKPWKYLKSQSNIHLNVIRIDYEKYPIKRTWNNVNNCYRLAKASNISYSDISLDDFKKMKNENNKIFCMGRSEALATNFLKFTKDNNYCSPKKNFRVNHMYLFKNCKNLD